MFCDIRWGFKIFYQVQRNGCLVTELLEAEHLPTRLRRVASLSTYQRLTMTSSLFPGSQQGAAYEIGQGSILIDEANAYINLQH